MHTPSVSELIPVLQTAIGPMILISGVGLLLLSMTNRLGRAIDRARNLNSLFPETSGSRHARIQVQLQILWRRARMIRLAITLAAMSVLAAAMLIIVLFIIALWDVGTAWLIVALFIICMASLIGSLIVFIHDIYQSLAALKLGLIATEEENDLTTIPTDSD